MLTGKILEKEGCRSSPYCRMRGAGQDRIMFNEAIEAAKNVDTVILTFCRKYCWGAHCTIGECI